MASKRILGTITRSVAAAAVSSPARLIFRRLTYALPPQNKITAYPTFELPTHNRLYSTNNSPKHYTYEEIKSLTKTPTPSRLLIDVREPLEFAEGSIPTAINIPLVSSPEALSLPEEEFEDRFGFVKPEKDREVVFYCKAGVRSAAAARLAAREGYEKVGEYKGSWDDWVEKGKGA